MVVIRRELPRTNIAGPATGLSHNTHEDPPVRVPLDRPLICPALIAFARFLTSESLRHSPLVRRFAETVLNGCADRPDEPQQLSAHRRDHLLFGLAPGRQLPEPLMQPMLRLPGDLLDLFAEPFLTLAQCPAEVGSMPVRP